MEALPSVGRRPRVQGSELRRWVHLLFRAARRFGQHDGATSAAALSYYMLLSLFPLLIIAVSVVGWLVRDEAIKSAVIRAIIEQLPAEANLRAEVTRVVDGVADTPRGPLELVGALGAGWTLLRMFGVLRRALNRAFDAPSERSALHAKVVDAFSAMVVLGLSAASVIVTTVLGLARTSMQSLAGGIVSLLLWAVLIVLIPLAISFLTFLVMFRFIPNVRHRLSDLWRGALFTALGFEGAKIGVGLYIANFEHFQRVYGALGAAVAFLSFVFVVANLVIFAAEVIQERVGSYDRTADPRW